jgi:AcrR family transcriptional regulator
MPQFIRTEEQAIIDTEALKLRSRGFTYQQIADNMGCSKGAAYQRVSRALAAIPAEAVDEYRRLEAERLDGLLAIATHQAYTKKSLFAIDRVLAIMDRRAKLLGLDSPVKHEVVTLDYVTAQINQLERELGVIDADASTEEIIGAEEAQSLTRGTTEASID